MRISDWSSDVCSSDLIGEDLDKAAQFNSEAEEARAQYEKALSDARTDAQAILREVEAGLAQAGADAQAAVAGEIDAQGRAAEERIASAKQAALGDLRTVAVEVAQSVASRLTGREAGAARTRTAVGAALQGDGKSVGEGKRVYVR